MHSDLIHPEQEMLLKLLSPSVDAQRLRLKRKIERISEAHSQDRAQRALRLVDLFPRIHYTEYRSLVGGLNYVRRDGNESWESILRYFSDLLKHPLSPVVRELCEHIVEITRIEMSHPQHLRSEHGHAVGDEEQGALSLSSTELIYNLLFCFRSLYPLGVNILAPDWQQDARDTSLESYQKVTLRSGSSYTSDRVELTPTDGGAMRVESFSRTSPLDPIESTELGRGQVISVGRGPLTSRHFVGFPIRCVSPNDVRVEQAMWSRAALILLISKSGGLFIFDRASRNSIVCESEWPNQSIKSFEYTPNLIMCDEEEGRDPLPHQERRPDQPNLRDTLSSFSFGSVVVKEYDREDEEC